MLNSSTANDPACFLGTKRRAYSAVVKYVEASQRLSAFGAHLAWWYMHHDSRSTGYTRGLSSPWHEALIQTATGMIGRAVQPRPGGSDLSISRAWPNQPHTVRIWNPSVILGHARVVARPRTAAPGFPLVPCSSTTTATGQTT